MWPVMKPESISQLHLSLFVWKNVTTLEAIACRKAISLAEDLMLQNFVVMSDSKQVIHDIKEETQGSYGVVINEIRIRSRMFNYIFSYEGRAANANAHSIAKFAHFLDHGCHL